MTYRKKLIEVALPLEVINKESAREKSICYRHLLTLHVWWGRQPLIVPDRETMDVCESYV